MNNKIVFTNIVNDTIFCDDFNPFIEKNELDFEDKNIIVLYGPNGIGKSSLANVLGYKEGSFSLKYKDVTYSKEDERIFHIIDDQINRNIIKGEDDEFVIGENIRRERELKKEIDEKFEELFKKYLSKTLKEDFNIATKNSLLTDKIENKELRKYVSDLANNRSKGKEIDRDNFIKTVTNLKVQETPSYDQRKFNYLINNYKDTKSIIYKIMNINEQQINKNENIKSIEEHDEAIRILEKFDYKTNCVVCDNDINCLELHEKKSKNREKIFEALDSETKKVLEDIIEHLDENDPFEIRTTLLEAMRLGNKVLVRELQMEIMGYFKILNYKVTKLFGQCLDDTNLITNMAEYNEILNNQPKFEEEDVLLIEKIINENMVKKIHLKRDNENIKLYIGDKELINKDREELHLSTGEQNFISLAFELLRAKRSDAEIIVLDDPISSFDSIYKNKIAFIIVKFLENKKQIILTHNTDLIKLLAHQNKNCFNLYLFNNANENEVNGFVKVNSDEREILLYLDKLLDLFRNDIFEEIENEEIFLISMVPFMRGYSKLIGSAEADNLSKLMHGYEDEEINITSIYHNLFGENKFKNNYIISAQDIIGIDIKSVEILKNTKYPLLNKTLKHNLNYLYLRMLVEDNLVKLYEINTSKKPTLGQIINMAFSNNCKEHVAYRVFLNSKKTLLNEFNHFEGNMNIFEPAIDITDKALEKENNDIIKFLEKLEETRIIKSEVL